MGGIYRSSVARGFEWTISIRANFLSPNFRYGNSQALPFQTNGTARVILNILLAYK